MAKINAMNKTAKAETYTAEIVALGKNGKGQDNEWMAVLLDSSGKPVETMKEPHPEIDGLLVDKRWRGVGNGAKAHTEALNYWLQATLDKDVEMQKWEEKERAKLAEARKEESKRLDQVINLRRFAHENGYSSVEEAQAALDAMERGDDDNVLADLTAE